MEDDPVLKKQLTEMMKFGKSIKDTLGITTTVSDFITINCPTCDDILLIPIDGDGEESCICGDWELEDGKAKFIPRPSRNKPVNN